MAEFPNIGQKKGFWMSHEEDEDAKDGHSKHSSPEKESFSKTKKPKIAFETIVLLAIASRIVLKEFPILDIPSLEPVIPLAVLAGTLYGATEGAIVGAFGYVFSNFFIDLGRGFGLWNLPQAIGGGLAGILGSISKKAQFLSTIVWGTIAYELILNIWSADFTIDFGYIGGSLPFSIIHILGNLLFGWILAELYLK